MSQDERTIQTPDEGSTAGQTGNLPPKYMRVFFGRIFPWPFFLVGVITLVIGGRGLLDAMTSTGWATVPGVVTSSEVVVNRSSDGTTFSASVVYEFDLEGTTYIGGRVDTSDMSTSNRARSERIVAKYPAGQEVTVYCHPRDPERSLLEPGLNASAFFLPGFGLVFFLAGTVMLIFLPKLVNDPNLNWSTT